MNRQDRRDAVKQAGRSKSKGPTVPTISETQMAMIAAWPEMVAPMAALPDEVLIVAQAIAVHTHALTLGRMLLGGELHSEEEALVRDIDAATTRDAKDIVVALTSGKQKPPPEFPFRVTSPPPDFAVIDGEFIWYEMPAESAPLPSWAEDQTVVETAGAVADAMVAWSEDRVERFLDDEEKTVTALLAEFSAALTLSKIWLWQLDASTDAPFAEDLAIQLSEAFIDDLANEDDDEPNGEDGEADEKSE